MPVVEYKMHLINNRGAMATPSWIKDGGYYHSPIDHTKVGWVLDSADREYYVPDSVIVLDKAGFLKRQRDIHALHPVMGDRDSSDGNLKIYTKSEAEVDSDSSFWWDQFVSVRS